MIGASETVRVRYAKNRPQVEAQRKRSSIRSKSGERAGARVPKVSSAGRKVANRKRDDRDKRRREISRRRAFLVVLAVAVFAVAMWGVVALWRAPLFTVETVDVTGLSHLTRADVLAMAAIPADASVFQLPKGAIASRIQTSPWVAHVDVAGHFPHTASIAVTERVPGAVVDRGAVGAWLVTGDGYWIVQRTNEPTATLVSVRDVPGLNPVAGAKVTSAELKNALGVIAGISAQTRGRTKYVSAATVEKTMLVLKNNVQIFVGSSDDIAKKDLIAESILSREKNVLYVNVRVTDRPTWIPASPGVVPVN